MKRVLILINHDVWLYNLRREVIEGLLKENYEVWISCPYGEKIEYFKEIGCKYIPSDLNRRSKNPLAEVTLLLHYNKIIKEIKPEIVLTYTIKPNSYGGIVCRLRKIPYIPNVTGLGAAADASGILKKLVLAMYKFSLRKAACIFFQNASNIEYAKAHKWINGNYRLIPGSGVNTDSYPLQDYPAGGDGKEGDVVVFNYIGRVLHAKGVDDYIEAAKRIKKVYPNTEFNVIGFVEPTESHYEAELNELNEAGIVLYRGQQSNVRAFIARSHATIHPSYYGEGMSNVLLESASSGRVLITTDNPGCRETVDDGTTGYIYHGADVEQLVEKIEGFLSLHNDERIKMGVLGRKKMINEFDRSVVVKSYLGEIQNILGV